MQGDVEQIARAYPGNAHLGGRAIPSLQQNVIHQAILRESAEQRISLTDAAKYLLERSTRFAEQTANWLETERRYIPKLENFFGPDCQYAKPDECWSKGQPRSNGATPQQILAPRLPGVESDGQRRFKEYCRGNSEYAEQMGFTERQP